MIRLSYSTDSVGFRKEASRKFRNLWLMPHSNSIPYPNAEATLPFGTQKEGRLGSYAKPEKRNLLSIFELRGYDRLLIRLFFKKYS